MNKLILKECNGERVVYLYLPEGQGEPGEVVYDIKSQETQVVVRASNDQYGRYGHNASRKMKEYVGEDYLPMHAYQAWY
jgi:hypothetical protein